MAFRHHAKNILYVSINVPQIASETRVKFEIRIAFREDYSS